MRSLLLKSSLVLAVALSLSVAPTAERAVTTAQNGVGPDVQVHRSDDLRS